MNTKDILQDISLPASGGISSYTANIGKTEKKGFEASINGIIIDNKDGWTWEAGLNFSLNRNKLTELATADEDGRDTGNGWFVGYPIDALYDYEKIGLWNETDADYQNFGILEPGGNLGMIKVAGGYYTQEELEAGTIPEGKNVGDPRSRVVVSLSLLSMAALATSTSSQVVVVTLMLTTGLQRTQVLTSQDQVVLMQVITRSMLLLSVSSMVATSRSVTSLLVTTSMVHG